jgi:hypothetical protein
MPSDRAALIGVFIACLVAIAIIMIGAVLHIIPIGCI